MENTSKKTGPKPLTYTELADITEINSIPLMLKRRDQINRFLSKKRAEILNPEWIAELQNIVKYFDAQILSVELERKYPSQIKLFEVDPKEYLLYLHRRNAGTQRQTRNY
jgi:hypothetical protein